MFYFACNELKYMKVSLFEITYKKKETFSRHSNLLRCTCMCLRSSFKFVSYINVNHIEICMFNVVLLDNGVCAVFFPHFVHTDRFLVHMIKCNDWQLRYDKLRVQPYFKNLFYKYLGLPVHLFLHKCVFAWRFLFWGLWNPFSHVLVSLLATVPKKKGNLIQSIQG